VSDCLPTLAGNPVPVYGSDVAIKTVDPSDSYTSGLVTNDNVNVTFGVKANLAQTAGTYTGDVLFTILGEANDQGVAESASVSPSSIVIDEARENGNSVHLTLATSLMTTLQYGDVTVKVSNTTGEYTCSNVTTSKDLSTGVMIAECDLSIANTSNISEEVPEVPMVGTYDVTVSVPRFSKSYVATNGLTLSYSDEATIFDIAYMQDMNSTICANTPTPSAFTAETKDLDDDSKVILGDTANDLASILATEQTEEIDGVETKVYYKVAQRTLSDIRDSKTYLTRKLADGNCWTVQSLDLDLDSSVALTADTTDLNSKTSWVPENSTYIDNTIWYNADKQAYSYSYPQNVYYINGYTKTTSTPTDLKEKLVRNAGNFYNYLAATADSGKDLTEGEAADSICAKGFQLPINSGKKSFKNIIETVYNVSTDGENKTRSDVNSVIQNINLLAYNRSGDLQNNTGNILNEGGAGHYRSSTKESSINAYYFSHHWTGVYTQRVDNIFWGFSVRCVAR